MDKRILGSPRVRIWGLSLVMPGIMEVVAEVTANIGSYLSVFTMVVVVGWILFSKYENLEPQNVMFF